jgi:hypothetical protein
MEQSGQPGTGWRVGATQFGLDSGEEQVPLASQRLITAEELARIAPEYRQFLTGLAVLAEKHFSDQPDPLFCGLSAVATFLELRSRVKPATQNVVTETTIFDAHQVPEYSPVPVPPMEPLPLVPLPTVHTKAGATAQTQPDQDEQGAPFPADHLELDERSEAGRLVPWLQPVSPTRLHTFPDEPEQKRPMDKLVSIAHPRRSQQEAALTETVRQAEQEYWLSLEESAQSMQKGWQALQEWVAAVPPPDTLSKEDRLRFIGSYCDLGILAALSECIGDESLKRILIISHNSNSHPESSGGLPLDWLPLYLGARCSQIDFLGDPSAIYDDTTRGYAEQLSKHLSRTNQQCAYGLVTEDQIDHVAALDTHQNGIYDIVIFQSMPNTHDSRLMEHVIKSEYLRRKAFVIIPSTPAFAFDQRKARAVQSSDRAIRLLDFPTALVDLANPQNLHLNPEVALADYPQDGNGTLLLEVTRREVSRTYRA